MTSDLIEETLVSDWRKADTEASLETYVHNDMKLKREDAIRDVRNDYGV